MSILIHDRMSAVELIISEHIPHLYGIGHSFEIFPDLFLKRLLRTRNAFLCSEPDYPLRKIMSHRGTLADFRNQHSWESVYLPGFFTPLRFVQNDMK